MKGSRGLLERMGHNPDEPFTLSPEFAAGVEVMGHLHQYNGRYPGDPLAVERIIEHANARLTAAGLQPEVSEAVVQHVIADMQGQLS